MSTINASEFRKKIKAIQDDDFSEEEEEYIVIERPADDSFDACMDECEKAIEFDKEVEKFHNFLFTHVKDIIPYNYFDFIFLSSF